MVEIPLPKAKVTTKALKLRKPHGMPPNSKWSKIILYDEAGIQVAPTLAVLAKGNVLVAFHHGLKKALVGLGQGLVWEQRIEKRNHRSSREFCSDGPLNVVGAYPSQ